MSEKVTDLKTRREQLEAELAEIKRMERTPEMEKTTAVEPATPVEAVESAPSEIKDASPRMIEEAEDQSEPNLEFGVLLGITEDGNIVFQQTHGEFNSIKLEGLLEYGKRELDRFYHREFAKQEQARMEAMEAQKEESNG